LQYICLILLQNDWAYIALPSFLRQTKTLNEGIALDKHIGRRLEGTGIFRDAQTMSRNGIFFMSTTGHKAKAPKTVDIGILSVSTTRGLVDDESGHWIKKRCEKKGHRVVYHDVVSDDAPLIADAVKRVITVYAPQAIIVSGGTGISARDVTIEAVRPLFSKELTAFGALFSYLSYEEIESAALLSRATAGLIGETMVFCIPGSLSACKLACEELILPELGHMVKHIVSG
jgi:molybdenum cofactor biosynthesis protein B